MIESATVNNLSETNPNDTQRPASSPRPNAKPRSSVRLNLSELWRWLILIALPVNQVAAIRVAGTNFNLTEFLAPILYATLLILLLRDSFPVPRYLVFAFVLLTASILVEAVILTFVHDNSPIYSVKLAIGQTFIFFTYLMFGRARPNQSLRHLYALCWIGGAVAIASILISGSISARLDSLFWGRSNLFGATLLPTVAAGIISILLYRYWELLLPIMASLFAIVLTQSRGSLLLVGGVAVLLLIVAGRRPLRTILGLAVLGLLFVGLLFIIPGRVLESIPVIERLATEKDRVTTYFADPNPQAERQVLSGRLVLWGAAIERIEAEPWVGTDERYVLPRTWASLDEQPGMEMTFHSWFLNIGAARGLIVLAFNIVVALVALVPYWKRGVGKPRRLVGTTLLIMLIYGLVEPLFDGGLFQLNMITLLFWILAGVGINLPDRTSKTALPVAATPVHSPVSAAAA